MRAKQVSDIKATYKLGLKMGDMFTGEAKITFKYSGVGDVWLNMSVQAAAYMTLNGKQLKD